LIYFHIIGQKSNQNNKRKKKKGGRKVKQCQKVTKMNTTMVFGQFFAKFRKEKLSGKLYVADVNQLQH